MYVFALFDTFALEILSELRSFRSFCRVCDVYKEKIERKIKNRTTKNKNNFCSVLEIIYSKCDLRVHRVRQIQHKDF